MRESGDGVVGTRARILDVAMGMFLERGYHAASMQQIADGVGITKAALYYHFSSKSDIVGSLIEPMAGDLERALDAAEEAEDPRSAVMEGYLDVMLRYRESLIFLARDVAAGSQDFYERTIQVTVRAMELITGPEPSLEARVRAAQVMTALADPVVLFPDVPDEELREKMLEGAYRLLG